MEHPLDLPTPPARPAWRTPARTAVGAAALLALFAALLVLVLAWAPSVAAASAVGWGALLLAALVGALAFLGGRVAAQRQQGTLLHGTRTQLQALNELIDLWQWRSDAGHRLTRWQAPAGADAEAWGGSAGFIGRLAWDHFSAAPGLLLARMQAHMPLEGCEAELAADADGAIRFSLRARALFDAEGRFNGYLGTARQLPDQPGRGAATQSVAEEQAAFSYTVSHDLRAPVRVVEGFTRILKEDYGRVLDRVGNDHLDRVLAAGARMNNMIDALLALAQLSTQPLLRQPVNLSQVGGFIVEELRRHAPERAATVEIEPGMLAQGDPTLLRVALENLLGNAWKYSAKREVAHIVFCSRRRSGEQVFEVRDNGAGFDMRSAERLFGVFQRLHGASEFAGTGVGLASVRRIVSRHGGQVWAEAEPGKGACFRFTLGAK